MMEETLMERLRRMADRVISERPSDRVLNFTLDGEEYWIKKKAGERKKPAREVLRRKGILL